MQGMDCIDGRSLLSAEFLGVRVSGDTDAHNVGKKRFKSRRSVFVFALPYTFDLGSGTDDWSLVSISSGLSFAFDYLSVLTPTAWRLWKHRNASRTPGLKILEILLLTYCVLTAFVFLQPEVARGVLMQPTFTDCLRRTFEIVFGLFVPYFVISRTSY